MMVASLSAQDPERLLPDNYQLQFENDYVKVVHVHIPAGAKLALHSHPAAFLTYVYLNDADPIVFTHGDSRVITRNPVTARSFRTSVGPEEFHAIENNSKTTTDYLRVQLKTEGAQKSHAGRRGAAPPLKSENGSVEEFKNDVMRLSRVTIAAGQSMEINADQNPVMLIDLTGNVGKERWIDANTREPITNTGSTAAEYFRFDFLTTPARTN